MNNWSLLLLALVAVFQPIASFTDYNLIDGRQQCCDRLSSTPLRDTRSSLHGTYWLGKTTPAVRLNDRDEIRDDRRYELRQRNSVLTRPSTERPLVDIRERGARQGPSVTARTSRAESRIERLSNEQSRDRLLDVRERERTARTIRDLKPQDQTRRVVDRTLERHNDRAYIESSRDRLSKDDYRTDRFSNERLFNNFFDSQRETQRDQIRTGELRFTPNRAARHVLRRTNNDVARIEASNHMNNRQHIARDRLSVERRQSLVRLDTRRYIDNNNERRDLERNNEQRRSLSENTRLVDRIRDMRVRLNSWEENRQNRDRISANQRSSTKRFDERREQRDDRTESRQQNKENTERRLSGERMQMARGITRESRIMNEMNTQNERDLDSRREIRQNDRMVRETRDENRENSDHRLSRERVQKDRRDTRESRIMITQNERDIDGRREIRHIERISRDTQDKREIHNRLTLERIQIDRRNSRASKVMNNMITRNIDTGREIRNERVSRETRDEVKENSDRRLSRERIQIERRNIREFRTINKPSEREVDNRREVRYNDRLSRETRDEVRKNSDPRLSRETIQMERKNIREFRTMNDPSERDVDSRREIRYNEKRSTEIMENPDRRLSRERSLVDRRNTREFRKMNDVITRNKRDLSRHERLSTQNRENSDHRLSRERIQMDRRHESRIMNNLNMKDLNSRQEIRYNERLSMDEIREKSDRRLTREISDRRDIRESRVINGVTTRNEKDIENRREIRYNERLSKQIRSDQFTSERRAESRSPGRVIAAERDNSVTDRRARSVDRRNFREIRAEPKQSRSTDVEPRREVFRTRVEHSYKIENREREAIDARSRNVESVRNRERISSVMVGKMEAENDSIVGNWQYVLYTLQAAYLCALFMQMLTPSRTEKSHKMSLRWLPVPSHYNPIKVD